MRPRAFKACSISAEESSFELIAMVRRRTPSSKWPRCAASRPDCKSIAASLAQAGLAAASINVAAVASIQRFIIISPQDLNAKLPRRCFGAAEIVTLIMAAQCCAGIPSVRLKNVEHRRLSRVARHILHKACERAAAQGNVDGLQGRARCIRLAILDLRDHRAGGEKVGHGRRE